MLIEFRLFKTIRNKIRWSPTLALQPKSFHVFARLHMPHPYFPPFPWFVKTILLPFVFYWEDRHIWRFGPQN